jgi:predicted transposase YdaD
MKALNDYHRTLAYAKKEGTAEGRLEGLAEGLTKGKLAAMLDMAKAMLAAHEPLANIVRYTGLSKRQLAAL